MFYCNVIIKHIPNIIISEVGNVHKACSSILINIVVLVILLIPVVACILMYIHCAHLCYASTQCAS